MDLTIYNPLIDDQSVKVVDSVMSVPSHTGAEYNVFGIESTSSRLRLVTNARPTGVDYEHGMPPIAYQGEFKNLASLDEADVAVTNSKTDLESLFEIGRAHV